MNKKRLIRDKKWFFQHFPYHQLYMNNSLLKGWVAINYITDGETRFWEYEKSGSIPICGKDMTWLTFIPDNSSRAVSVFFSPERRVTAWYIDVIESVGIDDDGVAYFIDKYLDVILTPQGDVVLCDKDELDAAYNSGELTEEQYKSALSEGERIIEELASDIKQTEIMCRQILDKSEEIIADDRFTIFLDIDGVLNIYDNSLPVQHLLPEAIRNLKSLTLRTKADIVIISDWRYGSDLCASKFKETDRDRITDNWNNLINIFEDEGIKITGITSCDESLRNRTEEIRRYLDEHSSIKRYVILDDCFSDNYESDPEIKKHLVFVNALKGLQRNDLIAACEIMNMLK